MKLGLGIGEISGQETADLAAKHGLTGLMLGGWQFGSHEDALSLAEKIRGEGLEVCQWGAWDVNPMQPTQDAIENAANNIRMAAKVGAPTAVTHGGGANPDHGYCGHPDNFTAEAVEKVAETVRPLGKVAEEEGVVLVLEPHFATALWNWDACLAVVNAIGSDSVKIQFDPANMVRFEDYFDTAPLLEASFNTLAGKIGSGHAKDISMANELHLHMSECPAGEGCLDYVTYIRLLEQELGPDGYLIIEHTPVEKVGAAVAYVRDCAAKANVTIQS